MKPIYFGVALCLAVAFTVANATRGGNYSVNVHFIPPLLTGSCSFGQFWIPPNVTCGLCFCMTGTLSRCIPQPGCNPSNVTNNATTTPAPTGSSSTSTTVQDQGVTGANHQPTQQQQHITPKPTQAASSENPTTQGQGADETTIPSLTLNLVRRRRRSSKLLDSNGFVTQA